MNVRPAGLLLSYFVLLIMAEADAHAGKLVIKGRSELAVSTVEGKVRLSGSYSISNSGDETANGVSPQFELGAWSWIGEPKSLDAGKELSWTINAEIENAKLTCGAVDRCAGLSLPAAGILPLLVTRHYQDLNGYRFSSTEVLPLAVGIDDQEVAGQLRIPKIEGKMTISGDGQSFEVTGELVNLASTDVEIAVSLFTSRELRVVSGPQLVKIPAGSIRPFTGSLENFSGLAGSAYAVHAVAQWREGEHRNAAAFSQIAPITKQSRRTLYSGAVAAVVLLSALAFYFSVLRKR